MMIAEKKTEAARILGEQLELFPSINESDIERTLFLLDKFVYMKMLVKDFEEHEQDLYQTDIEGETARRLSEEDTHADKTSNAIIFHQKRKWIYNEYKIAIRSIERAHRLIIDEDMRKAVHFRYLEGHKFMIALKFTYMSKSTFQRKLNAGVASITDTLKLMGILGREWKY
ncbi:hypothetical protein [Paenibacillus rigui]|uniref:Uncharacterized protein n=1 Tax=Paenibacillus rigui TaxID=554312 RepID=A0A229UMQ6_9BACL|nr:hypothetical protein [Paenibacillus rigui]OXM84594.1 hypothetical protein CF651_18985 [Paenibacillus rigui]